MDNNMIIEVKNFGKGFCIHHLNKNIHICKNISFNVNKGDFLGITGKSGSGKSTILKAIYRTYLPGEGEILYNSKEFGITNIFELTERQIIYLRKNEIGYVSQFLNVMPRVTAIEIVENAVIEMGESREKAREEAEKMLTHFDLDKELWNSYPLNFSGGEKLRLNIAAAMIKKPHLLLLDEPTASLDSGSKEKVKILIEKLKEQGTTMIGIFHDIDFMESLCNKRYEMPEN